VKLHDGEPGNPVSGLAGMDSMEGGTACILVVDDLPENARLLRSFLHPLGFNVDAVYNGEDALAQVRRNPPDVILLDLMMPVMDGYEVCRRLKQEVKTRHIPVIIITGLSDREANIRAVQAGADDFLIKPFDRVLLEARINTSLKTKMLQDQILANQRELERRVRERTRQLELTQQVAVFSLAKLAESRDHETGGHLHRIREYARVIAQEMSAMPGFSSQIDAAFIEELYLSCPLHDIGKVGIPDHILLKPGRLTPEEFSVMKNHSSIGGDTLLAADREAGSESFLAMGCDIAYYHHERWDGKGYPDSLRGEGIPLSARIVALADVYDALSSKRPYKAPFDHCKAREILIAGRGNHFDPAVVEAFTRSEKQFEEIRTRPVCQEPLLTDQDVAASFHKSGSVRPVSN
jgi:putative two-component system response regulator